MGVLKKLDWSVTVETKKNIEIQKLVQRTISKPSAVIVFGKKTKIDLSTKAPVSCGISLVRRDHCSLCGVRVLVFERLLWPREKFFSFRRDCYAAICGSSG